MKIKQQCSCYFGIFSTFYDLKELKQEKVMYSVLSHSKKPFGKKGKHVALLLIGGRREREGAPPIEEIVLGILMNLNPSVYS